MADEKMAKLYETQISLTEWLERAGLGDAAELRKEDGDKASRIESLHEAIGLPCEEHVRFDAVELLDLSPKFSSYLTQNGEEACRLRLVPKHEYPDLPKLRMRGLTVQKALKWFKEQGIEANKYVADFVPHPPDYSWSTIFVVNNKGIFGEIHFGPHSTLTQGFGDNVHEIATFSYDYSNWVVEPQNDAALAYLEQLVEYIHVTDTDKRRKLTETVSAEFTHDYIKGYFETTHSEVVGTWFIDYSRILGKRYEDFVVNTQSTNSDQVLLRGRVGSTGKASGEVCIVEPGDSVDDFPEGAVLVCAMTSPDYLPFMQKASAIVTDQGGILCHAAIVARELKKPCIVGTQTATQILKPGDKVVVDADTGTINSA